MWNVSRTGKELTQNEYFTENMHVNDVVTNWSSTRRISCFYASNQ